MRYWNLVVQETTTFTLPNPDEYERPDEIREVELNRVKAKSAAVEGDALSFVDKLRASLLGQLNEAIADWDDRDLRRSFVHMQVIFVFYNSMLYGKTPMRSRSWSWWWRFDWWRAGFNALNVIPWAAGRARGKIRHSIMSVPVCTSYLGQRRTECRRSVD